MAESTSLLRTHTPKGYRGFKSLSFRSLWFRHQRFFVSNPQKTYRHKRFPQAGRWLPRQANLNDRLTAVPIKQKTQLKAYCNGHHARKTRGENDSRWRQEWSASSSPIKSPPLESAARSKRLSIPEAEDREQLTGNPCSFACSSSKQIAKKALVQTHHCYKNKEIEAEKDIEIGVGDPENISDQKIGQFDIKAGSLRNKKDADCHSNGPKGGDNRIFPLPVIEVNPSDNQGRDDGGNEGSIREGKSRSIPSARSSQRQKPMPLKTEWEMLPLIKPMRLTTT